VQPSKFLCLGDRRASLEPKHRLRTSILIDPEILNTHAAWLAIPGGIAHKYFADFGQTLRKIGEEFYGNFAPIASRAQNVCYGNPAVWLRAQK